MMEFCSFSDLADGYMVVTQVRMAIVFWGFFLLLLLAFAFGTRTGRLDKDNFRSLNQC